MGTSLTDKDYSMTSNTTSEDTRSLAIVRIATLGCGGTCAAISAALAILVPLAPGVTTQDALMILPIMGFAFGSLLAILALLIAPSTREILCERA